MEASSLPRSPLFSSSRSLAKPLCSLGAAFPKLPLRPFSFSLSSTRAALRFSPLPSKFASLSFSVTALSPGGGDGGDALAGGGGGGGGGDGSSGGGGEARSLSLEEALSLGSDVIVLYVGVTQLSFYSKKISYNLYLNSFYPVLRKPFKIYLFL